MAVRAMRRMPLRGTPGELMSTRIARIDFHTRPRACAGTGALGAVRLRLLHLADLHVGKRVCDFPMIGDQRHVLGQVLDLLRAGTADALLVAGDVYDKSQPSSEAVALVDRKSVV